MFTENLLGSKKPIPSIQFKTLTPLAVSEERFHSFGSTWQRTDMHSTELPIRPLTERRGEYVILPIAAFSE